MLHFVLYLFSFLDDHLSHETDFASGFKTNIYQKFIPVLLFLWVCVSTLKVNMEVIKTIVGHKRDLFSWEICGYIERERKRGITLMFVVEHENKEAFGEVFCFRTLKCNW